MKGITLLFGVFLLVVCNAFPTPASPRFNPLKMCGITEEKDETLHKCLSDYREKQRVEMEKLRNHAGEKNFSAVQKVFRDSLKCFTEENSKEKKCYVATMFKLRRAFEIKEHEMEILTASSLYKNFMRFVKVVYRECILNEDTAPFLVSCIKDFEPEAKKIIEGKVGYESYKRMAELISGTKRCYANVTSEQGLCIVQKSKVYKQNEAEDLNEKIEEMVRKLKNCKISAVELEDVSTCVKTKGITMLNVSFEKFEKPEYIDEMWNLAEDMKECFDKYPDVKKCKLVQKHDRAPFHPLKMCGITEEKDATLHKCLSDYREKQRVEMKKLRNHAGEKDFSAVQKVFRDSLKCFTEENSKEKKCYVSMFRVLRAFEIKEHEMEILTAASLYKNFMRFVKVVYRKCILNEDTAPFLVSCIKDLEPEAKKIIAGKVGYESYKRMAELITGTKRCYANITSEQGLCVVKQSKVHEQNEAEDLNEKIEEMVQELKNCKISAEELEDVSTCVKTKGITMLNVSFEKFEKPEYIDEMWNLAEDMKECFDKYPDVKKCKLVKKHDRAPFHPLKMCGITKEKDATLHKCLSDYREKLRVEMKNLRNHAGEKDFSVVQKVFRDSLKCFTEENSNEKKCYVSMFRVLRAFEIKEHEMEILTAASLYKNFMRFVKVVYRKCILNKDTAPFLVSCIKDLEPEAKKIIAGKVGYESYKRMAELITGTKHCYANITSEQGLCVVKQSKVHEQNEAEDLNEKIEEMVQKLKNCKISVEELEDVSTCVKTKGITMLNVSFEKFEKPEYIDEMWNLAEDMKECFDKYPDVKKCKLVKKHDRAPFHPLKMCGITEEKDATLHKCLSDYREKQRVEMKKLRNHAGEKDFSAVQKVFRDSLKCFTKENSNEKKCYVSMFRLRRAFEIKEHEMEILTAASLYKNFMRFVKVVYRKCILNEGTAPFLVSCIKDLEPEAKKIIAGKVGYESYKRMAELITGTKRCYANITSDQGLCVVKQSKVHEQNEAEDLNEKIEEMVRELKNCKISAEELKDVSTCVKTKGITMLNVSFEMFEKPEYIDEMWNLAEDMKECFDKYPNVKKCKHVQKHDRAPFHPLKMCGITEEKDATLHKCLSDYREKQRVEMKKLRNHAGEKDFSAVQKVFRDSLKCFTKENSKEKKCYVSMFRLRRAFEIKEHEMEILTAASLYKNFMRFVKVVYRKCILNEGTAPFLVSCIKDLEPEAKKIIAGKVGYESYKRMAELITGTKRCYANITSEQGLCVEKQSKVHEQNEAEDLNEKIKEMVQELKNCKISAEELEDVSTCVKTKGITMLNVSFEKFEKPEYIDEMWNLAEDMKECFDKYPDVKKCKLVKKHDRAPFHPLKMCGITEEKDETLHKCLSDYREKQRVEMKKLRNHAGEKDFSAVQKVFRDSLKCFTKENSKEKKCYVRMFRLRRAFEIKEHEMEILTAASLYKNFMRFVKVVYRKCILNEGTAPFLVSCIKDLEPEAKKIIAGKVGYESYKRMAELITDTKRCYANITSEQGLCVVQQSKVHEQNEAEDLNEKIEEMVQKLKNCKISAEEIEDVSTCVKTKGITMLNVSFEKFEKPEYVDEMWNLAEDMKECFDKYPDVKKCKLVQKHDRAPRREHHPMNPFHFENVTNFLINYITEKSKKRLGECKVLPAKMSNLYICLGKKYKENKEVYSSEPKTKFTGMMRLMNESAECFMNVTAEQGLCLLKNKQEMVKFVDYKARAIGKLMDQLLGACKATPEMLSCVNEKKMKLYELSKTILTTPDNAAIMWDLGSSLKTCLTDETVKQCVLSKKDRGQARPGKDHGRSGDMDMQKHIVEKWPPESNKRLTSHQRLLNFKSS